MQSEDKSIDYWGRQVTWTPLVNITKRNSSLNKGSKGIIFHYKKSHEVKTECRFGAMILSGLLISFPVTLITVLISVIFFGGAKGYDSMPLTFGIDLIFFISIFIVTGINSRKNFIKAKNDGKAFEGWLKTIELIDGEKIFLLDKNLSDEQIIEIVDELNGLKSDGNQKEYMKIVEKIIESDAKTKVRLAEESKLKTLEEKKIKFEKIKENPFLNGELYTTELQEITKIFNNLNSNNFSEDFYNRLAIVSKKIDELYSQNESNQILKDCRRELLDVTSKYNKMLSSGVNLTVTEVSNYENLVNTCEKIIELNVNKELTGELNTVSQVSTIYLKDKYNV